MLKSTHFLILLAFSVLIAITKCTKTPENDTKRNYNGPYFGAYLNRVAFPIGGIGAGMICLAQLPRELTNLAIKYILIKSS